MFLQLPVGTIKRFQETVALLELDAEFLLFMAEFLPGAVTFGVMAVSQEQEMIDDQAGDDDGRRWKVMLVAVGVEGDQEEDDDQTGLNRENGSQDQATGIKF